MARPLRIEYPGAFYHITSRGNERKPIYRSERDREKFLEYLKEAIEKYRINIYVYCLMSNHYHLLLETREGNLSKVMRFINGSYVTYFNKKRSRSGHLLQGRYKSIVVDKDAYCMELSRYIHLNPVRARLVSKPDEYYWSSYREYTNDSKSEWINTEWLLRQFGMKKRECQKKYQAFVEEGLRSNLRNPIEGSRAGVLLGREDFQDQIRAQLRMSKQRERDLPALRELRPRPTFKEIIHLVDRDHVTNIKEKRKAAIYLSHLYSGKTLKEIAEWFGGIQDSGVCQIVKRFTIELEKDKILFDRIEKLKVSISN